MGPELRVARLLRMAAALEEAIIRLESRGEEAADGTIRRLRLVQGEILAAAQLAETPTDAGGPPSL